MSSKYTLGIDFGSLSARAVIADTSDGKELASRTFEYPHAVIDEILPETGEKLPPMWAIQDPEDYRAALFDVVPGVIKESGINPSDLIAAGIDFTCSTFFPIYADGTPLRSTPEFAGEKHAYSKMWKHHAAQGLADVINEKFAGKGYPWMEANFGGKISGEFFIPKVWETLREAPKVYEKCDCFIEAADWINFILTGKITRSYVINSYKAGYRPDAGFMPKDCLRELDSGLEGLFDEKDAGDVLRPGEVAGYVCASAAEKLGLPEGIPVAASLPDAHAGGFPMGLRGEGDMLGIFGTSNCYFLLSRDYQEIPGICGTVKDAILPGYWCYESGLCCFGDHFAWAAEKICPADYANEAKELGISPLQLLIRKASQLRPGESGLLALDWWNGNRSVLVNSNLSGMLLGLTLTTKPEHIMRALIEATAFGTKIIFDTFAEKGIEIKRFIAAGGVPRKDPFTMQLFADVLGLPIEVSSSRQAGALGSAVAASVAAGREAGGYDTLEEACEAMSSPVFRTYYPDAAAGAAYGKLYREYRRLHDYFGRGENPVMNNLRKING